MAGHLAAHVVIFVRQLRTAGLRATSQQAALFLESLDHVGLEDRLAVRGAARATLAASPDEVALVDAAFDRFWRTPGDGEARLEAPLPLPSRGSRPRAQPADVAIARRLGRHDDESPEPIVDRAGSWSAAEILRQKRFDRLTANEAAAIARVMSRTRLPPPQRITRRYQPAVRGRLLDWRRTIRGALRHDGEIVRRRWRTRRRKPRPLVVLADISGSMERYARMTLYVLHGLVRQSRQGPQRWAIEVFLFGTRLTRVTRALQARHVDSAVDRVSRSVVDWSGGTRIGESLYTFNRDWSRRILGRGAIVALISDGWDQGQPELVTRELGRLRRSSRRLYWLNPLATTPGFEPRTAGLIAAMPVVDAMLPAGNLDDLERAIRTIAH